MPRINVDDEVRADPRFHALCSLIPRNLAFGALICLWELGQAYWKKGAKLIPFDLAEQTPNSSELLRTGFLVRREGGFYCTGAEERWGFLLARSEAGKRSAEARKLKFGTAIPFGASNRTNAEHPPNKTEHSSSSSSSVSKNYYTPLPPKGEDRFDEFWILYPRKIAKEKARQVWKRKKLGNGKFDLIITALQEQKNTEQWTKDGGQFIPHASTWLNQERWNDDLKIETKETSWSDEWAAKRKERENESR